MGAEQSRPRPSPYVGSYIEQHVRQQKSPAASRTMMRGQTYTPSHSFAGFQKAMPLSPQKSMPLPPPVARRPPPSATASSDDGWLRQVADAVGKAFDKQPTQQQQYGREWPKGGVTTTRPLGLTSKGELEGRSDSPSATITDRSTLGAASSSNGSSSYYSDQLEREEVARAANAAQQAAERAMQAAKTAAEAAEIAARAAAAARHLDGSTGSSEVTPFVRAHASGAEANAQVLVAEAARAAGAAQAAAKAAEMATAVIGVSPEEIANAKPRDLMSMASSRSVSSMLTTERTTEEGGGTTLHSAENSMHGGGAGLSPELLPPSSPPQQPRRNSDGGGGGGLLNTLLHLLDVSSSNARHTSNHHTPQKGTTTTTTPHPHPPPPPVLQQAPPVAVVTIVDRIEASDREAIAAHDKSATKEAFLSGLLSIRVPQTFMGWSAGSQAQQPKPEEPGKKRFSWLEAARERKQRFASTARDGDGKTATEHYNMRRYDLVTATLHDKGFQSLRADVGHSHHVYRGIDVEIEQQIKVDGKGKAVLEGGTAAKQTPPPEPPPTPPPPPPPKPQGKLDMSAFGAVAAAMGGGGNPVPLKVEEEEEGVDASEYEC